MDIKKLTEDCRKAREAALRASEKSDDGGTCNLDATFLSIGKGNHSRKILAAITASGLTAHMTKWLGRGIMIAPPGDGQGNRRYVSNNALLDSLISDGWDVLGYYQMD